jgi:hypothetical protein
MDRFEQRIVLKFPFLKGIGSQAAHIELSSVLGEQAYSFLQAKQWIRRFKDDDLSCQDGDLSGRPFSDLSDGIQPELFSCRYCTSITEGKLEFQVQSWQKRVDHAH